MGTEMDRFREWTSGPLDDSSGPPPGPRWSHPVPLGLILGAGFGLWNLIATLLDPLAEDDLIPLLTFYGPMFAIWGLAAYKASRRTGQLWDAVKVGAVVAFITFAVYTIAVIIRVNVFLDIMSRRPDWQNLIERFQASGFRTLRGFVNYEYATGAPFKIIVATMIGVTTGLVGGLLGCLGHRMMRRMAP
jgi:membrane protein implicated in regulation of membrane protease activity